LWVDFKKQSNDIIVNLHQRQPLLNAISSFSHVADDNEQRRASGGSKYAGAGAAHDSADIGGVVITNELAHVT
jgi:hypothetical protein